MGRKYFTVSFDDGTEQDVRVIDLMRKYGIRGTFNLSSGLFGMREEAVSRIAAETLADGTQRLFKVRYSHNIMPADQAKDVYADDGIEIAGHGRHHMHQADLSGAALYDEIAGDAARLSDIFGRDVRGHIFPYGEWNEECLEVMKASGLVYGRAATSGDPEGGFAFSAERGIIKPTCRLTDVFAVSLLERFISTPCAEGDMVFYFWGHSFELDYGTEAASDSWLEELFKTAASAEDINFVTNGELIDALGI